VLGSRILSGCAAEQRDEGLDDVRNSSGVILTLIVMVSDKNAQFLVQASLRLWNIPET